MKKFGNDVDLIYIFNTEIILLYVVRAAGELTVALPIILINTFQ